MTQQAKILSFDEAKRVRTSHGAHSSSAVRSYERASRMQSSSRDIPRDGARSSRHASAPYRRGSDRVRADARSRASRLEDEAYAASRLAYDESLDAEENPADCGTASRKESSRFSKMKRNLTKNKADRAFSRQYGGDDSASAADAGPRAAVYKGEMGQSHRRASRMQGERASEGRKGSSEPMLSRIPKFMKRPWFLACAGGAVCLVLTAAFLYPSAEQLYHSARERDQLQAEYAAIEQRNDAIQSSVDALSTDAGVEDRAHKEFGWVSKNENAVTVYGLSVDDDSTFTASVVPGSVPAPETWYSKLFGPLFGEE